MADGHWMSPEERRSWEGAKGASAPEPAKAGAPKKPTPAKLNALLLEACERGDRAGAAELIAQGASPNARLRANPGESAMAIALDAGHDKLALEVMRAGGWPAPSRWGGAAQSDAFDAAAKAGSFEPAHRSALAVKALEMFIARSRSWAILKDARDWCARGLADTALASMAMEREKFALAAGAEREGLEIPAAAWSVELAQKIHWHPSGLREHPHREGMLSLLARPRGCSGVGPEMADTLHRACCAGDDPELMAALLDAGLRPSADWTLRLGHPAGAEPADGARPHLLALAAGHAGGALFEMLKKCDPALQSARQGPAMNPRTLAKLPIGRLMEMMELGVALDGRDAKGRGLAHVWAELDNEPRDGWATLAKRAPAVFEIKDGEGRTGAMAMAEKMRFRRRDEFLASLARIEVREIKREIAAPASSLPAAPRQRL